MAESHTHPRSSRTSPVLWASAFVLAALVILQAGQLPANPAFAGVVSNGQHMRLLSADNGRGADAQPDEVVYLIDNRTETLLLYELEGGKIVLRDGVSLPTAFQRAAGR